MLEGYAPVQQQRDKETFARMSNAAEKEYIQGLISKVDALIDHLISVPIENTKADRWRYVKGVYKQNI